MADLWGQLAFCDPGGELLPGWAHDLGLLRQVGQPKTLHAGGLGIHGAQVELRGLASSRAVLNDAAKIAQAARALGGVFASEHLEDGVDAFAVGEVLHYVFIVMLLVVDGVLQAELLYAGEFFVGGRSAVHFHAKQVSDLDQPRNGAWLRMDQNP